MYHTCTTREYINISTAPTMRRVNRHPAYHPGQNPGQNPPGISSVRHIIRAADQRGKLLVRHIAQIVGRNCIPGSYANL